MPGVNLTAGQQAIGLMHTLEMAYWRGTVDYNGQTQNGTPLRTDTDQAIWSLDYRADWRLPRLPAGLYGRVGWQNWDRDIQPAGNASGLFERYRWWTFEAGFSADILTLKKHTLTLELGGLVTRNGTIEIDLRAFGVGEPELDLGDGSGFAVRGGWQWQLGDRDSVVTLLEYEFWDFARSENATVSDGMNSIVIAEPESDSKRVGLSVQYVRHFGAKQN